MLEKFTHCDERQFKALTGLSGTAFHKVLAVFIVCYQQDLYNDMSSYRSAVAVI